jgi:hypothetical protein
MNGAREIDPVQRPTWLLDLAAIAEAGPIRWALIWEEARARDLLDKIFHALNLVHHLAPNIVPRAVLDSLIDGDPEFRRRLQRTATAEARMKPHRNVGDDRSAPRRTRTGYVARRAPGSTEDPASGGPFSSPHYVRYFLDADGTISKVQLQSRHLPLLSELFDVTDQAALRELIPSAPKPRDAWFAIPPGLLATKPRPVLEAYSAKIRLASGLDRLVLARGEVRDIVVEVENTSSCCWAVCGGSTALFGVSYRLLSGDRAAQLWIRPPTYLFEAIKSYVSFVEPSQRIKCSLRLFAPRQPGQYVFQLDLVHEHVLWFTDCGNQFPCIHLEVRDDAATGRYEVCAPEIVHETIGNETMILNSASGAYYSTSGFGSAIWNAVVGGHDAHDIVSAFASTSVCGHEPDVVEQFILELLNERLVRSSLAAAPGPSVAIRTRTALNGPRPVLVKHAPMKELLTIQLVGRESSEAGWPYRPKPEER